MLLTMIVSLYTSRVVLNVLGVDDFGVYQTVGGIVALIAYTNNALAVGTSRFLTYELGTGNIEKLKTTFSTALSIHIIFSLIIVILAETIGLWYVYNKLVVSPDRFDAAVLAYHFSVFAVFVTVTQIPYNSSIISHERMKVFAYVSIIDVVLKLMIVYVLTLFDFDKLKFYAILLFFLHVAIALFYRLYCIKNFEECRYHLVLSRTIFKRILSYSGWNLIATSALALCNHGITVMLNFFFSPAVVSARAVANQVNMAANSFVGNFRTAIEPQVVKQFAAKNYKESETLLLESTKYSFYIMLILALPIFVVAEPLLVFWLGFVPDYAPEFLQLAVLASLAEVFNRSFYTALYAKGQIKENACIYALVLCLSFAIIFFLFRMDFSPLCSAYVILAANLIMSFVVKPFLLVKITNYPLTKILVVIKDCLKVFCIAFVIILFVDQNIELIISNRFISFFLRVLISIILTCIVIWFFGVDKSLKEKIINYLKMKCLRRK